MPSITYTEQYCPDWGVGMHSPFVHSHNEELMECQWQLTINFIRKNYELNTSSSKRHFVISILMRIYPKVNGMYSISHPTSPTIFQ